MVINYSSCSIFTVFTRCTSFTFLTFFTFRTIINRGVGFGAIRVSNSERMSAIMVINYSSCSVFTVFTRCTGFTFFTLSTIFYGKCGCIITSSNRDGMRTIVIVFSFYSRCYTVSTRCTGFTFLTTSTGFTFFTLSTIFYDKFGCIITSSNRDGMRTIVIVLSFYSRCYTVSTILTRCTRSPLCTFIPFRAF